MASLYKKPVFIRDPRTGRRVKTKSKKWWGRYRDASGREKRVPLAIDRTAAQVMLSEYVRRAERQKAGLVDPTDEHLKKPLSKHVADYKEYLKSKANSPRYIEGTESRIKAVCTGCRFRHIGQIAHERCQLASPSARSEQVWHIHKQRLPDRNQGVLQLVGS